MILQGGIVGGSGNLGGIVYTTVARHSSFHKTLWTTGLTRCARSFSFSRPF